LHSVADEAEELHDDGLVEAEFAAQPVFSSIVASCPTMDTTGSPTKLNRLNAISADHGHDGGGLEDAANMKASTSA
jgi:hypothetical protein